MFGGIFGGEDESSGGMDASEESGFAGNFSAGGGQGFGGEMGGGYGQGMPGGGWTGYGTNVGGVGAADPAETAARDSRANLESGGDGGQSTADSIGKTGGLFSSIYGMFDARAKRLRRRQRVFSRNQAAFKLAQAKRNVAQYAQDSAIQEQKLSQSYAGRGIGESSIQQEGMQYFRDTRDRTMEGLAQQAALAQNSQDLVRSEISMSYANVWLSFGNSVASLF